MILMGSGPLQNRTGRAPRHDPGINTDGMGWTSQRCDTCHTPDPVFSHPVGFRPERPLPDRFPLQNGEMTCLTCHDASDALLHNRAREGHTSLLRSPFAGRSLCSECHQQQPFSARSGHAGAVSKAHLLWPGKGRRQGRTGGGPLVDNETESCLECHDGTLAKGIQAGHGGADLFRRGVSQEHPVGVPYRTPPGKRGISRMVDARTLDERVRLFDGAVGCGSCHSVYSPIDNNLVMSNHRSALCLSCHDG